MNEYYFNYKSSGPDKPGVILYFTFIMSLSASLLLCVLANGLLAIFSFLIAIILFINLRKRMHHKIRQKEHIITSENDFSCIRSRKIAYRNIIHIHVPVEEIGALGSDIYERYKNSDIDLPYLNFTITMSSGEKIEWILNEWGGFYNSKKDFETFFIFLVEITTKIHQLYDTGHIESRYLKILDQNGDWNL
ncbi:hypothetical protein [Chryseobacterium sp. IT-36CA2]|uniref:hypothetical protein n=1 Tax=Chryseobacterium sp. IT-36CA2 TaxID=3026460 RepID=UPI0039DF5B0D